MVRGRGYEGRIKGRGVVIKGWAPQILILSHAAIGGFLTHCGWNSTIEGVCAGVPMVTWPLFAEQFLNEKLIVQVLKMGVRVGVEVPVRWGDENKVGVSIKRERIKEAIEECMEEDRKVMTGGTEQHYLQISPKRLFRNKVALKLRKKFSCAVLHQ
ncbi:UDP-glycosyltransferase 73D1-like [Senna tora]|uniref:UDP-glycosyltransferase 73D1-like n=1 Tax=Senna tora TaxID=362788 RepID=A0A834TAQ7_9FABA|nr:UDP-glycosyltransferase 73D1-like [Senna tora]